MVRMRYVAAVLVLVASVSVGEAIAQERSFAVRFQAAKATLQEYEGKIADWERGSSLALVMVVALASLGALTMVLQAVKRPWVPIATVVTGALVSSVTVVNNALADGDYKTLNKRAAEGRRLLRSATDLLALQGTTPEDNEEILKEVQKKLISLALLDSDGRAVSSSASLTLPGIEVVALASAAACGCSGSRAEPGFRYFCATATSKSITDAKQRALESALKDAAIALKSTPQYLRDVATEADSCISRADAGYAFSVWLKMPLSLVSDHAQMAFSVPAKATRVRLKLDAITVLQDGSSRASTWLFDVLVDGRVLFSLPNRSYSDDAQRNTYRPAATDPSGGELQIDAAKPARIDVRARRSVGSDTAVGSATLDANMTALNVAVKNAQSESKGSFQLRFSILPVRPTT